MLKLYQPKWPTNTDMLFSRGGVKIDVPPVIKRGLRPQNNHRMALIVRNDERLFPLGDLLTSLVNVLKSHFLWPNEGRILISPNPRFFWNPDSGYGLVHSAPLGKRSETSLSSNPISTYDDVVTVSHAVIAIVPTFNLTSPCAHHLSSRYSVDIITQSGDFSIHKTETAKFPTDVSLVLSCSTSACSMKPTALDSEKL